MISSVEKWGVFDAAFAGPADGNPFVDVAIDVEFCFGNRRIAAPGFYDGDGVYRVRFMPDAEGEWSFQNSFELQSARWPHRPLPLRIGGPRQSRPGPCPQSTSFRLR